MPPALSRKGCFLKGGGTFCQREKVPPSLKLPPPPSALYQSKFFCKRRHAPPSLQTCSDPSARGMPILCEASVLHMAGGSLFRHGTFRCRSGKAGTFYATPGAASLPVYGYHTAQVLQPGLSPLHDLLLSALYSNPSGSCRCAEMCPYRPSPMKDAGAVPRPLPRKKEISLICGRP